jgi:hypothetical protein
MAGTTTNNGWDYPTSTDYVKDGATAIQTLADDIDTSVGTGLLQWTSYTPTLGGTGWALGSGSINGYYSKIGRVVNFQIRVVFGAGATFGAGRPTLTLPVTARSTSGNIDFVTDIAYEDASAGARYSGTAECSTSALDLFVWNSSTTYLSITGLSSAIPMTWAANDIIFVSGTYESAS